MNYEKMFNDLEIFINYEDKQNFSSRCVEYLKLYTDNDLDEFNEWVANVIVLPPGYILNPNLVSLFVNEAKLRHLEDRLQQISYVTDIKNVTDGEEQCILDSWKYWYHDYHIINAKNNLLKSFHEYGFRTTSFYIKIFTVERLEDIKAEIEQDSRISENDKTKLFYLINSTIKHKTDDIQRTKEKTYSDCAFL